MSGTIDPEVTYRIKELQLKTIVLNDRIRITTFDAVSPEGIVPGTVGTWAVSDQTGVLWIKQTDGGASGWQQVVPGGGSTPTDLDYLDARTYGMSPTATGLVNSAALNAAIAAAAVLGERNRVYIAPGQYAMGATIQHRTNVIVFGTGPNTILNFASGVSAWDFANAFTRAELAYMQILGIFGDLAPVGFNLNQSQRVCIHDLQIWDFAIGVLLSDGAVFSGYHDIGPNVEINRCPIGVQAWENANACAIRDTRIFFSHDGTDTGIGIDIRSAQGLEVDNVQIEGADTCIRIRNTNGLLQTNVHDCYLEPGSNPTTATVGQCYDVEVENLFDGIEIVVGKNNVVSGLRGRVRLPPEGFFEWDGYSQAFYGARFSGAATPKRNYCFNGQVLYYGLPSVLPGWGASGSIPTLAESPTHVTGNRSLSVTATGTNSTASCGFTVSDDGVDWVTCGVRYMVIGPNVGFAFSGVVGSNTRQYVPDPNDAPGVWREAWVQVPVGANRSGAVSIVPDAVNGSGTVLIDEVWAVAGRFAVSSVQYGERIQMLPAPITIYSATVTANEAFGPIDLLTLPSTLAPPLDDFCTAPTGVVGAVIRMQLTVDNAPAGVMVDHHWVYLDVPASGAVVAASFVFVPAIYSQQPVSQDIMLRDLTISGGYNAGGLDGYQATYSARLVAWILG